MHQSIRIVPLTHHDRSLSLSLSVSLIVCVSCRESDRPIHCIYLAVIELHLCIASVAACVSKASYTGVANSVGPSSTGRFL
jgi:hypothetical protein